MLGRTDAGVSVARVWDNCARFRPVWGRFGKKSLFRYNESNVCRERDLNPHALYGHRILSATRLPITPSRPTRYNSFQKGPHSGKRTIFQLISQREIVGIPF